MKKLAVIFETLTIGAVGGGVFSLLHFPLSWLLGAIVSVIIWKIFVKKDIVLLPAIRNTSLVIIGFTLGTSFTYSTLLKMLQMLPAMFMSTIVIIGCCIIGAFLLTKFTALNLQTTMIGMMPGGLTHMVVLGEEIKQVDVTAVTILQLIRLFSVIYIVPFIVKFDLFTSQEIFSSNMVKVGENTMLEVMLFVFITLLSVLLALKINIPTPYIMGPIFSCATLVVLGFTPFQLPDIIMIFTQIVIGIHIGSLLDMNKMKGSSHLITGAVLTCIILILIALLLAFGITKIYPISIGTSFLSSAPGGIAEMGLTAKEIGADLSIVTAFQLFRVFFIIFLIPPFILLVFKKHKRE